MSGMREPDRVEKDTTKARVVNYIWELRDRPWDGEDDPSYTEAYLHVAHDKIRKCYYAMLMRRGVIMTPDGYTVHSSSIAPGESVMVAVEATGRYSGKQLTCFAAEAYNTLRAALLSDESWRASAVMAGRNWREG